MEINNVSTPGYISKIYFYMAFLIPTIAQWTPNAYWPAFTVVNEL